MALEIRMAKNFREVRLKFSALCLFYIDNFEFTHIGVNSDVFLEDSLEYTNIVSI